MLRLRSQCEADVDDLEKDFLLTDPNAKFYNARPVMSLNKMSVSDPQDIRFGGAGANNLISLTEVTTRNEILDTDETSCTVNGVISFNIDWATAKACNLHVASFGPNPITFAKDVKEAIDWIFTKFNCEGLDFGVVIGNPAEKIWDKTIKKLNGKVVGYYKRDVKLIDNKLYDMKVYEVMKEDYFESEYYKRRVKDEYTKAAK